jgi:hypothetical protein
VWIFFIFWLSKIHVSPTSIISSLSPLTGATSPPTDDAASLHRVMLPSYGAKTRSLPPLHLLLTLHPVAISFEAKLKYLIRTTDTGNPPQVVGLTPSITIKKYHINLSHSFHYSAASPFYLISNQSTISSELHPPSLFSFTVVSCPLSLHTMTPAVMN